MKLLLFMIQERKESRGTCHGRQCFVWANVHKLLVSITLDTIRSNLIIACLYQSHLPSSERKDEDSYSVLIHCAKLILNRQAGAHQRKLFPIDNKEMDLAATLRFS